MLLESQLSGVVSGIDICIVHRRHLYRYLLSLHHILNGETSLDLLRHTGGQADVQRLRAQLGTVLRQESDLYLSDGLTTLIGHGDGHG